MDWGHLPHGLLDGVNAQVAEHEEAEFLRRSRLVSHHWCRWATQATTHLKIPGIAIGQRLEGILNGAVNCFTGMEHVILGRGGCVGYLLPLQRAPHLRTLKIDGWLTDDAVAQLGLLTSLVDLDATMSGDPLSFFHETNSKIEALTRLTQLERVVLKKCNGDVYAAILAALPMLREVRLDTPVTSAGIRHLATLPCLVRCALGTPISVKEAEILGTMTNLEALSITGNDAMLLGEYAEDYHGENCAAHLCSLTNLTKLDLGGILTTDAGIEVLTCLTAVSQLCLQCGNENTDESLKMLQQFPALSSLGLSFAEDLNDVPLISNSGFRYIGVLTGLVDLQIRFGVWDGIDGDDLIELTSLASLTGLDMVSFKRMENTHVAYLGSLVMLKQLNLTMCKKFNDVGCLSVLMHLTDLDLSCTRVTGAGFNKLTTLKSLTKLGLRFCQQIENNAVEKLAEFAALAVLDLSYCQGITNAGVMQLRPLRFLRRLKVFGCGHVTIDVGRLLREWECTHESGLG